MRRLLLGGLFGALVGAAVGVGYAFTFRMPMTPNASLLVAIAVGILVSGLVRRPPWRQQSAVETVLRASLGALLGGAFAFVARRTLDGTIPFSLPPMREGTTFTEHAWLFPTVLGFAIGALVRSFGGDDVAEPPKPTPAAKADSPTTNAIATDT